MKTRKTKTGKTKTRKTNRKLLKKQRGGDPYGGISLKDINILGGKVYTPIQEDSYKPYDVVKIQNVV